MIEYKILLKSIFIYLLSYFIAIFLVALWLGFCIFWYDLSESDLQSPLFYSSAWILGITACLSGTAVATAYLVNRIWSDYVKHCLLLVGIPWAIGCLLGFATLEHSYSELLFYLIIFPQIAVSLITCKRVRRLRRRKLGL